MKSIKIQQIKNGYVMELFGGSSTPSELDYSIFYETLEECLKNIEKWAKKLVDLEEASSC